jgi:hypothetical protein
VEPGACFIFSKVVCNVARRARFGVSGLAKHVVVRQMRGMWSV